MAGRHEGLLIYNITLGMFPQFLRKTLTMVVYDGLKVVSFYIF